MSAFFEELFEYNHYCNLQWQVIFENNTEKITEKTIRLFSHVINAHHIWNHRIDAVKPLYEVWQLHPVNAFKDIAEENHSQSIKIISSRSMDSITIYTNSSGHTFNNPVRDILFHIINHSTYHRAQMAAECKQNGLQPPATDYIFYKRKSL